MIKTEFLGYCILVALCLFLCMAFTEKFHGVPLMTMMYRLARSNSGVFAGILLVEASFIAVIQICSLTLLNGRKQKMKR